MKVYVTKYALTSGIFEREVLREEDRYYCVSEPGSINDQNLYYKPEAFTSYEDACKDVLLRIEKKRKSIDKALKKLDKLETRIHDELDSMVR